MGKFSNNGNLRLKRKILAVYEFEKNWDDIKMRFSMTQLTKLCYSSETQDKSLLINISTEDDLTELIKQT